MRGGNLGKGGEGAVVTLDCDHPPCAFGEQRPRQPARTGTDLDDRDALE